MEFLLEINTEEMPSSHTRAGLVQIKEKLTAELAASRIALVSLETYGTSRRMVVAGDFAPRQEDKEELVVGPPQTVAFSLDGSPTAAAKGFAKAQNVELEKLQIVQTPKGAYLGLKRVIEGRATRDVLAGALPAIITSLSFPKMMRWGESNLRFSRPIKNILCLFGGETLPFSIDQVKVDDFTTGHKIHSPQKFRVRSFREYKALLKKNKVIISKEDRKKLILDQIEKRLEPLKGKLYPDEELLEKLAHDVECPYVFLGTFPLAYLKLPLEVLSVAMREGQKLFSVVQDARQLPYFLGVADAPKDPKSLIRKGNERVLKARLEDAKFFWEQDLKVPLSQRAAGLRQVVFQEKLGSYEAKTARLKSLVGYLCDKIDEKRLKKDALRAAELCKVDLLTEMVREFPSLQGKVGGLYAKAEGYPVPVAQAVYEHYKPVSLEDDAPFSLAGALISLADKLDSVVGALGTGVQVSGSSDPFSLRRNANGIAKVILDKKLVLSFGHLLEKAISIYGRTLTRPKQEIIAAAQVFFEQRLRYILEMQGYRYDLVSAALGAGLDNVYYSFLRLKALDALKKSSHFEPLILMAKRVNNILRGLPAYKVNGDLFMEKEERELFSTYAIIKENVSPLMASGDFARAQNIIFRMNPALTSFFERVLVMAKDKKVRQNRLALLQAISQLLLEMADYSEVVVEGEK
jgi:glycyl-tRNA synthetase beta chain